MSGILALASDFIERMTNPAYGIHVNEDYGLRFADLMETEDFRALLRKEMSQLKSPDALTSHGWIWLLGWARSQSLGLDENLLLELARRWSNPFMQIPVIDLATIDTENVENAYGSTARAPSIITIRHPFLHRLLTDVTTIREVEPIEPSVPLNVSKEEQDLSRLRDAENTLVALLQVNRQVTLEAAIALLRHPWAAQKQLLEFYRGLREQLDEETTLVWKEHIDVFVEGLGDSRG